MSANLFTVIAALPAVLGFGALISYFFTRYNRSPDPVTLKILDLGNSARASCRSWIPD